jgi:hypothetical protein
MASDLLVVPNIKDDESILFIDGCYGEIWGPMDGGVWGLKHTTRGGKDPVLWSGYVYHHDRNSRIALLVRAWNMTSILARSRRNL